VRLADSSSEKHCAPLERELYGLSRAINIWLRWSQDLVATYTEKDIYLFFGQTLPWNSRAKKFQSPYSR
jgi:hypothetical protein